MNSLRAFLKIPILTFCIVSLVIIGTSWGTEKNAHPKTKKIASKTKTSSTTLKKKTTDSNVAIPAWQNPKAKELKIGVCLPLSGEHASEGTMQWDAIMCAHMIQPTAGNKTLQLIMKDTQSTTTGTVQAATSLLTEQKVDGLIGGATTEEAAILIDLVQKIKRNDKAKPFLIITTATGVLMEDNAFIQRICSPLSDLGHAGAAFTIKRRLGHRAGIMVNTDNTEAATLAGAFSSKLIGLGGKVVDIVALPEEPADLCTPVMHLCAQNPDVLFLPYSKTVLHIIRELRRQDAFIPILVTNIPNEKTFLKNLGALRNIYIINDFSFNESTGVRARNCMEFYQKTYQNINSLSALAADAYFFLADNLKDCPHPSSNRHINQCGKDYLTGTLCRNSNARISRTIYLLATQEEGVEIIDKITNP